MHAIVTGAAGFIGSTLSEKLIGAGHRVTGIDCFHTYYDRNIKEGNLRQLRENKAFTFHESNLLNTGPDILLSGDIIYHLAAQPGVRASWGESFSEYVVNNIQVTQRILEIVKGASSLKKFVFASSSSVYGACRDYPLKETAHPNPVSPYGVTKLAAEHLCSMYRDSYGVPVTSLRYFTAYGPRQRPDMAFHKFFRAVMEHKPIVVYGDGNQTRDFTFVSDIAEATMAAGLDFTTASCRTINIGAGSSMPLNRIFGYLSEITGSKPEIQYRADERGDMRDTLADITAAREVLGYSPKMAVYDGLERQYEWMIANKNLLRG